MTKQKRSRWTEEEVETLIQAIVAYLRNNPGKTLPQCYRAVKNCLPKDRQSEDKCFSGMAHFEPYMDRIKELLKVNNEVQIETKVIEKKVEYVRPLIDISTEELQAELWRRNLEPVLPILAEQISRQVSAVILQQLTPKQKGTKSERERLRRVLILGLKPTQYAMMQEEFEGLLEIRNYKDQSPAELKGMCTWADEVIIMTKFISHSQVEIVRAAKQSFTYCNGMIAELEITLRDILDKVTV